MVIDHNGAGQSPAVGDPGLVVGADVHLVLFVLVLRMRQRAFDVEPGTVVQIAVHLQRAFVRRDLRVLSYFVNDVEQRRGLSSFAEPLNILRGELVAVDPDRSEFAPRNVVQVIAEPVELVGTGAALGEDGGADLVFGIVAKRIVGIHDLGNALHRTEEKLTLHGRRLGIVAGGHEILIAQIGDRFGRIAAEHQRIVGRAVFGFGRDGNYRNPVVVVRVAPELADNVQPAVGFVGHQNGFTVRVGAVRFRSRILFFCHN